MLLHLVTGKSVRLWVYHLSLFVCEYVHCVCFSENTVEPVKKWPGIFGHFRKVAGQLNIHHYNMQGLAFI